MQMDCITAICNKQNTLFVIDPSNAVVPSECEIGILRHLFSYFQYIAPNIDSVHSPILEASMHEEVLHQLLHDNSNYHFCAHNLITNDELKKLALEGDLICSKCKRFLCKRSGKDSKREPKRKETDLECLLRHLRNSIAHGHVYIVHGGNTIHVCFEDINPQKKTTARIVCTQAELKKWRSILVEAISSSNSAQPNS